MLAAALFLIVAILATPLVGTVIAGKGQEKLDFVFHINGASIYGSWDKLVMSPPEDPISIHVKGQEYAGDFFVEIGLAGTVETIATEFIDYDCELQYVYFFETSRVNGILVKEVISIYGDGVVHDETTFRGTLELSGTGQGQSSFVGFGTGEFEGVKVKGFTEDTVPNMVMDRVGTVMGWPT